MLNKKLFILFLFLTISATTFSQSFSIDSVEQVIRTTKNDSIKLRAMSKLGWHYSDRDFEKSLQKAEEMLELATKVNRHVDIANAYNLMGYT